MIRTLSSHRRAMCATLMLCAAAASCEKTPPVVQESDSPDATVDVAKVADMKGESGGAAVLDLGDARAPDQASAPDWTALRLEGLVHRPLEGWRGCKAWLASPDASGKVLEPDGMQGKLVSQVSPGGLWRVRGAYHEGYNKGMRGKGGIHGVFEDDGDAIALRWRQAACDMAGYFVLRDALFNQQDHPVAQPRARALMMPPNWVVKAAWLTHQGEAIKGVRCAAIEDDAAWATIASASPEEAFGSFDPSSSIYEAIGASLASGGEGGERARTARESMCALSRHVEALEEGASRGGWQEVLATGAERIAWGDREYFGEALREQVFIPIFVENPDEHERGEGKGLEWSDFSTLLQQSSEEDRRALREVVRQARKVLYGRRLQDGPLALERYDLSNDVERARVKEILRDLAPGDAPSSHVVWIWVTGKLDEGKKLKGESALAYLADFKKELVEGGVSLEHVRWLSKPAVHVDRKISLERRREIQRAALEEHERAGLSLMSVTEVVRPE